MDKIKLMDTHKYKKRRSLKKNNRLQPVLDTVKKYYSITVKKKKEICSFIEENNYYRIIREWFIVNYLNKTAGLNKNEKSTISWQPWLFFVVQIFLLIYLSLMLYYTAHPLLSGWIEKGLAFFKLDQIYKFKMPDKSFFSLISRFMLLFVIGYYGFFFALHQLPGLFSSITVSRAQKKIYYIKSYLIFKELYVFSVPEIELIILKQNIFSRIIRHGTLVMQKKSGDKIINQFIKKAPVLLREISEIKNTY